MSNSNLINYTKISPNSTNPRQDNIKKITIHHMAGNLSIEGCGDLFANPSRQASANYGIDSSGRIGMYVEENNRAWTSGNADNDNQAVTIEVANDGGAPDWHVSDTALAKLIDLCTDICRRNNIPSLNFTGNANGNLTMHCYFQATACPGPYLKSKFAYIADEVNKRLKAADTSGNGNTYKVQVGAYSVKSNADAMLAKVKAAGFDTYMVQADGMYKIQVGAYNLKSNAEAMQTTLKLNGFDAFITTEQGKAVSGTAATAPVKEITVGSTVKLTQGAKTYDGKGLASFVYARNHEVKEISGDRVVITYQGTVVAAVKKSDLTLV